MKTNEVRLIDANELLSKMYRMDEQQKTDVWMTCDIDALLEIQPTVDAVEVVHGEWEFDCACEPYCSVCGEYALDKGFEKLRSRYCPKCGAMMENYYEI